MLGAHPILEFICGEKTTWVSEDTSSGGNREAPRRGAVFAIPCCQGANSEAPNAHWQNPVCLIAARPKEV